MEKERVYTDTNRCKGCGYCIKFCPKNAIRFTLTANAKGYNVIEVDHESGGVDMSKILMKGNEALAEAALAAGCRFYSGYPITPQTEILEYLSWRMEEVGGEFIQAESELSGINMVLGAAAAGARAMTSSSRT